MYSNKPKNNNPKNNLNKQKKELKIYGLKKSKKLRKPLKL